MYIEKFISNFKIRNILQVFIYSLVWINILVTLVNTNAI